MRGAFRSVAAASCVVISLATGATAQENGLEADVRKCSADTDSVSRLACYDAIAAPLNEAANAAAERDLPTDGTGEWDINVETSAIDDTTNVFLSVASSKPYEDDFDTRHPRLWIRCMENTTALLVEFDGDYMSDFAGRGRVTFRIDQAPAFERDLHASTDHGSLGLWTGGRSIPLIKDLLGAGALLVRAIPVNASPVLIEFPIAGLDQAIAPVRENCGW